MKKMHKFAPVALLSGLGLMTSVTFAGNEYPTNPERSFIDEAPPAARTTAEVRAELEAFRHNPVSADGWKDVGGERGEAMITYQYAFVDGKLVASGNAGNAAPSRIWNGDDVLMASLNYRNTY